MKIWGWLDDYLDFSSGSGGLPGYYVIIVLYAGFSTSFSWIWLAGAALLAMTGWGTRIPASPSEIPAMGSCGRKHDPWRFTGSFCGGGDSGLYGSGQQ